MTLRIALVGYGVGGRLFHAPYIDASDRWDLAAVVARSPQRAAELYDDMPVVPCVDSLAAALDLGVDAVAISTPPATRRALVLEAVRAGVHVVADKPFAPSAAVATELAEAAEARGVLLDVFHNRRFDADIVTARGVIASGALGRIDRLDLRCDQDERSTLEGGPDGGLLRDLGSHVVDQALVLMGPATAVTAHLDHAETPAGETDAAFALTIEHTSGAHSHVSATKIHGFQSRELRLLGSTGSYRSDFRDVQVDAIRAGRRPIADRERWGLEAPERWGTLTTSEGARRMPAERGDYTRYYDAFADAIVHGAPRPAPAREGIEVLRVLDAARRSDAERRTIAIAEV